MDNEKWACCWALPYTSSNLCEDCKTIFIIDGEDTGVEVDFFTEYRRDTTLFRCIYLGRGKLHKIIRCNKHQNKMITCTMIDSFLSNYQKGFDDIPQNLLSFFSSL